MIKQIALAGVSALALAASQAHALPIGASGFGVPAGVAGGGGLQINLSNAALGAGSTAGQTIGALSSVGVTGGDNWSVLGGPCALSGSNLVTTSHYYGPVSCHVRDQDAANGNAVERTVAISAPVAPTIVLGIVGNSFAQGVYTGPSNVDAADQINDPRVQTVLNTNCSGSGGATYSLVTYRPGYDGCGNATAYDSWGGSLTTSLEGAMPGQRFVLVVDALYGTTLGAVTSGDGNPTSDWSESPTSGTLVPQTATALANDEALVTAAGYAVGPTWITMEDGENDGKSANLAMSQAYYANEQGLLQATGASIGSTSKAWGWSKLVEGRVQINGHWPNAYLIRPQMDKAAQDFASQGFAVADIDAAYVDASGHPAPNPSGPNGNHVIGLNMAAQLLGTAGYVAPTLAQTTRSITFAGQGQNGAIVDTFTPNNTPAPASVDCFLTTNPSGHYYFDAACNLRVVNGSAMNAGSETAAGYLGNPAGYVNWTDNITITAPQTVTDVAGTAFKLDLTSASYHTDFTSQPLVATLGAAGSTCSGNTTVNMTGGGGAGAQASYVCVSGVTTAVNVSNQGSATFTSTPTIPNSTSGATATVTKMGATLNVLTDGEGSGLTATAGGGGRRPQETTLPGCTTCSTALYFSPQTGSQADEVVSASANLGTSSTTEVGISVGFQMTALPTSGAQPLAVLGSISISCNSSGTLQVGDIIGSNSGAQTGTTSAPCQVGTNHVAVLTRSGASGVDTLTEDGTAYAVTFPYAIRSNVTTGSTQSAFVGANTALYTSVGSSFYVAGKARFVVGHLMSAGEVTFAFQEIQAQMQ